MDNNEIKKLINGVIENEFSHIQERQEREDTIKDFEINAWNEKTAELCQKLFEVAPEHSKLIDEFDSASAAYWSMLCRYYFKKGILASATSLKFLEDTSIVHLI